MSNKNFLTQIQKRLKDWTEKRYSTAANRHKERKKTFQTNAGITVQPLYCPDGEEPQEYFEKIGFPGEYPFTRGPYPIGYRSRYWQPRQYCGFGTGEETNQRLKFALGQGETGLNVIVDLPTSYHGIDADDPRAEGEVGKTGVSLNSIEDMHDLFDGIPIDQISITFNTTGIVILAMYFAMAQERDLDLKDLWGTALNNPLASYVSCNSGVLPAPKDALRELTDIVEFTTEFMPNLTNIGKTVPTPFKNWHSCSAMRLPTPILFWNADWISIRSLPNTYFIRRFRPIFLRKSPSFEQPEEFGPSLPETAIRPKTKIQ
jgi:methylmalonyl-CoA mutase N-terminal domain/subunit